MPTAVTASLAPVVQYGTYFYQYGGVSPLDVFVFTFSDGRQIAISDYDDKEYADLRIGVPADDTLNFHMYYAGTGATFTIYAYSGGALGAPIYTFSNADGTVAAGFQLSYSPASQALTVLYDANASSPDTASGAYGSFSGTTLLSAAPVCFLRGTLILTDRGEVAVERLRPGDLVAARFGGLRPIRWIGRQSFDGRLAEPGHHPVRIRAGALGPGLPRADLFVSPGHAVVAGELLVHASVLANGATIAATRVRGPIEYYHLDLGEHDCVMANGLWAESYFEDRNRDRFDNAASFRAAFPGHVPHRQPTCLPIVTAEDPRAAGLHARYAPRLADAELAADPDLHLLADGRRIDLAAVAENTWQATLPPGIGDLRLLSRATRPSMAFGTGDRRPLGVMVWGIDVAGPASCATIPADHPWLTRGWHAAETDGRATWRWTDGEACLPVRLLGDRSASRHLTLRAWHLPRNHVPADADGRGG